MKIGIHEIWIENQGKKTGDVIMIGVDGERHGYDAVSLTLVEAARMGQRLIDLAENLEEKRQGAA